MVEHVFLYIYNYRMHIFTAQVRAAEIHLIYTKALIPHPIIYF